MEQYSNWRRRLRQDQEIAGAVVHGEVDKFWRNHASYPAIQKLTKQHQIRNVIEEQQLAD